MHGAYGGGVAPSSSLLPAGANPIWTGSLPVAVGPPVSLKAATGWSQGMPVTALTNAVGNVLHYKPGFYLFAVGWHGTCTTAGALNWTLNLLSDDSGYDGSSGPIAVGNTSLQFPLYVTTTPDLNDMYFTVQSDGVFVGTITVLNLTILKAA